MHLICSVVIIIAYHKLDTLCICSIFRWPLKYNKSCSVQLELQHVAKPHIIKTTFVTCMLFHKYVQQLYCYTTSYTCSSQYAIVSRVDILSKISEILPQSFPRKGILWHIFEKFLATINDIS